MHQSEQERLLINFFLILFEYLLILYFGKTKIHGGLLSKFQCWVRFEGPQDINCNILGIKSKYFLVINVNEFKFI